MTSTAYSRLSSKLPAGERRLMRTLTSKMEPAKKLGVGVIAGCCLALLTYVSLAKLFAIYSPVFASTANTSAALMPPSSSKPSVPETEAIIPPQETPLAAAGPGAGNNDGSDDPVVDDLPAETTAGQSQDQEPAGLLPEKAVDDDDVKKKRRKETAAVLGEEPGMKPQMLIVSRRSGAGLLLNNLDEVAAAASELGFNVTLSSSEAGAGDDVPEAQVVNSADVVLAVHGAGLTASQIGFLPTRAVLVQIVVPPPWGKGNTNGGFDSLDRQPDMMAQQQLRHLEYHVGQDEETQQQQGQGWRQQQQQDVSVSLTKFRLLLLQVLDKLQE